MADIARQIYMDPALTADLLKIVNSAQYMLSKKVESIAEAVKMVGIRGIKNLLYSYGSQKILGGDAPDKKHLWEHSHKAAFFAYNLAKNFRKNRELLDDAYLGGILHDMGKIVFSNAHPDFLKKIEKFVKQRKMPASTLEDLAAGMNHAEIGARIAEKWNFPEDLVASIRYHHDPSSAPEEYKDLVSAVYLANVFCGLEKKTFNYDQIDPSVLANFGINSKKQVEVLLEKFTVGFKQEIHT